jgi:PHD/YefM family antitoxin component YafN of YafNO toxin-antitoxin module
VWRVRVGRLAAGSVSSRTAWYACVRKGTHRVKMETVKVGMREFRDKLATYLLESEAPLAITRHGDTIGYFLPARRKRSDADKAALKEAAARWQEILDAEGILEDETVDDFKHWRSKRQR